MARDGEAPLAGENGRGKENDAVPFTAFTENFSSMPLMAPPPLGREIAGISIAFDLLLPPSDFKNPEDELVWVWSFTLLNFT